MRIHIFHCMHGGERIALHDVMRNFMSHESRPMSFYSLPYNFHIFESTLCYQLMVFTCWQMLSLSTPFKLIWFMGYSFSRNCCDTCDSNEGWSLSQLVLDKHVSPFCCRGFGMFTPKQMHEFFHQCSNMAWGAKGSGGPPPSILCAFYRQKVLVVLKHV